MTEMEPSLKELIDMPDLKWVFVGGKGGVGKTTSSCSLAVQLAKVKESVLIISTDPAHNLSDAFNQKFTREPTKVDGFENLSAMEIDPTVNLDEYDLGFLGENTAGHIGELNKSVFSELLKSVPGIDEAMSFAELMKYVQSMKFSTIVFDTAPTGHTLRLLAFPKLLEKGVATAMSLKAKLGGLLGQIQQFVPDLDTEEDKVIAKLEETKKIIDTVNQQFQDPEFTTFVCVMIPEFLSLYETERLIQELTKNNMDSHCIIVNQLLFPSEASTCKMCKARVKIQKKYLDQTFDLYEDFNVVLMPLLHEEIRGPANIGRFSEHLVKPYKGTDGDWQDNE